MSGRLADIQTAVDAQLPNPQGASFLWLKNTGAGAVVITPFPGTGLLGGSVSFSLPPGKELCSVHYAAGAFWQLTQAG